MLCWPARQMCLGASIPAASQIQTLVGSPSKGSLRWSLWRLPIEQLTIDKQLNLSTGASVHRLQVWHEALYASICTLFHETRPPRESISQTRPQRWDQTYCIGQASGMLQVTVTFCTWSCSKMAKSNRGTENTSYLYCMYTVLHTYNYSIRAYNQAAIHFRFI